MSEKNKSFTHNELFKEFITDNRSIREIARKYKSTYCSVKHQIEKFGLRKKDYLNLTSKPEEEQIVETTDNTVDEETGNIDEVPMVWKAIFQTVQQIYRPEVLKYVKNKNILRITIGNKNYIPEEEFKKVKAFLNYETLEYRLIKLEKNFLIEVSIKQ